MLLFCLQPMKGLKLMIISGLLKTTLLDYPQHVAATIFLGGCNFRCPFCHNSDLLEGMDGLFSKEEVLTFLKKKSRYPGGGLHHGRRTDPAPRSGTFYQGNPQSRSSG